MLSFEFSTILLSSDAGILAISKAFNLILFLGILYLLIRKPLSQFFKDRNITVREMLETAAREKAEAEAKMKELDSRLNKLDSEIAEIKATAVKEANVEHDRIAKETNRDIEKLRETASREIDSAKQVAMAELKEFAAGKAVDLAEQMIRSNIKPDDDVIITARVTQELNGTK